MMEVGEILAEIDSFSRFINVCNVIKLTSIPSVPRGDRDLVACNPNDGDCLLRSTKALSSTLEGQDDEVLPSPCARYFLAQWHVSGTSFHIGFEYHDELRAGQISNDRPTLGAILRDGKLRVRKGRRETQK